MTTKAKFTSKRIYTYYFSGSCRWICISLHYCPSKVQLQ